MGCTVRLPGCVYILPSFKNNTAITLGEELKQYEDWCRSPVEASRGAKIMQCYACIMHLLARHLQLINTWGQLA
jgi:hypothetical protein